MNVMIVGPEGAGKTVLAAVLSDHISRHRPGGLQLREESLPTKQYCADTIQRLRNGEWPDSTRKGTLQKLSWSWGIDDTWHSVDLIDPPGQDIREELCGDSARLGLKAGICNADLILLVVDLTSHQVALPEIRIQNAWIVEDVLKLVDFSRTRVLLVASKADELQHILPESKWNDRSAVLEVLTKLMPEFNATAYSAELSSRAFHALAVAAVVTERTVIGGRSEPVPSKPLEERGVHALATSIAAALRNPLPGSSRSPKGADSQPKPRWKAGVVIALSIAALLVFTIRYCDEGVQPVRQTFVIPCEVCSGDGWIERWWWWDTRCSRCGGTGSVQITLPIGANP
jgi:hypothetical protein